MRDLQAILPEAPAEVSAGFPTLSLRVRAARRRPRTTSTGGLIDTPRYLKLLSRTITGVAATPGRQVQSVAEASFDAWVKYYRSDENTPNATVSYYTKGALVALALDLTLRGQGTGTLDDAMRWLWRISAGGPIDEAPRSRPIPWDWS